MSQSLRLLILEDSPTDTELIVRALRRADFEPQWQRVDTEADYLAALDMPPDLILADFALPQFDGLSALKLLRARALEIPFVLVSGVMGEDAAVEAMKNGASDFLLKARLHRLGAVVGRVLEENRLRAEHRQAEEALREKEHFLQRVTDVTPGVLHIFDLEEQRTVFINRSVATILGYSADEVRAMGNEVVPRLMHPDDLPRFEEHIKLIRALADGEIADFEHRLRDRTGAWHWFHSRGAVFARDAAGAVRQMIGAALDITSRKQTETALSASEERLRLAMDAAQMASWDWDMITGEIPWSPQHEIMFGHAPGTSRRTYADFKNQLHPEDARRIEATVQKALKQRTDFHCECRVVWPDGSIHWLSGAGSFLRDSKDRPIRMLGMLVDITERKRAEQALHNSRSAALNLIEDAVQARDQAERAARELLAAERLAQSTIEAIPAWIAVLDDSGVIISTNQSWLKVTEREGGFSHSTRVGSDYLAACEATMGEGRFHAVQFAAGTRDVLAGRIPSFAMEYPCHLPGEQRWFIGHVTPFAGDGPRHVVIAHLDISQRKRAEQIVRRLNEELEHRVEMRTLQLKRMNENLEREIAAGRRLEEEILQISEREQQRIGQDLHDDLGQQLAGAWMISSGLARALAAGSRAEEAEANTLCGLLQNALNMTRSLARGLHPVAAERGGLMSALQDLAERATTMFRIDCRFECAPPIYVEDPSTATHVYRIAQEAISNAVKHGRAKKVRVTFSQDKDILKLTITDDGVGIGHEKARHNGEGMGLRIINYRADMIGGHFTVARQKRGGTRVTCTFPLLRPTSSPDTLHDHENTPAACPAREALQTSDAGVVPEACAARSRPQDPKARNARGSRQARGAGKKAGARR